MPQGKGTYGSKRGRPPTKKKMTKRKRKVVKRKGMKRGKNKAIARKRVVRNEAGVVPNPNG